MSKKFALVNCVQYFKGYYILIQASKKRQFKLFIKNKGQMISVYVHILSELISRINVSAFLETINFNTRRYIILTSQTLHGCIKLGVLCALYTKIKFKLDSFQTHYFWSNAKKVEMIFCLYMCSLMGKRLAMILNSLLSLQSVLGKKCKKSTFLRENVFESSFIKLTFRWLQTGLSNWINT